ncbi:response regulator transcription factor [Jannaschia donghaensis]|uniref:Phosphate regulon transcriptional regulatory protein PhoB n=1 Tax=Jannaschia donghaensis TaxID=420998 RepID=A0A0M6YEX7_9RHOB|nr:response regulator transcription factor [Jannaschia donghaensis]CTQ48083.1 Phosphate regulon transcriptional regulatory protein PhoB [Jannaschia donghaensis]
MKILVVDDDPQLRELVSLALTRAGFDTVTAADGRQALIHATREAPDLIVLDVGLPEMDGFEVCRRIRATSQVPILFLTAQDDEVDRIVGLELGADDYVTKPFSPRELVARLRAILKRAGPAPAPTLTHGTLTLEEGAHRLTVAGTPVDLTGTEHTILRTLLLTPDRIIARPALVDRIWGVGAGVSDRTLDSHLRNLRRKLAQAGADDVIRSVHGVGIGLS